MQTSVVLHKIERILLYFCVGKCFNNYNDLIFKIKNSTTESLENGQSSIKLQQQVYAW